MKHYVLSIAVVSIAMLAMTGLTGCPPAGTPTPATVGALTATIGFAVPQGASCTGSVVVSISGPNGAQPPTPVTLNYSGLSRQIDNKHQGCSVSNTFGSLPPGTWTVKASTGGACPANVVAGGFANVFIWELVCS
jgi:hypothetical protein